MVVNTATMDTAGGGVGASQTGQWKPVTPIDIWSTGGRTSAVPGKTVSAVSTQTTAANPGDKPKPNPNRADNSAAGVTPEVASEGTGVKPTVVPYREPVYATSAAAPTAATTSTTPAIDTTAAPTNDYTEAANTTKRITDAVDMAQQIGEANTAWQNATQNYGNTANNILGQYQQNSNQGLDVYNQNAKALSDAYSRGINDNLDQYGQNAQAVRDAYGNAVGSSVDNYDANTGKILDSLLGTENQEISDYEKSAQNIIQQLSTLTAGELADYANKTGQTIAEATAQINDILKGLQGNLKEAKAGRVDRVGTADKEDLLQQIADAQRKQAANQIDYAVNQGVNELQRAQEDAQQQFQTQRNQISAQERQALDNQALYSEMRGDRGGVGQAQYNAIQNNAATNQLTVNQSQTKLATDTSRQIADLRAQGEFDKADKYLQISQEYLGKLMQLKQWADEANISIDEFNIGVEQWEQEYNTKIQELLADLGMEATKYTTGLNLDRQQYLTGQNLSAAERNANLGLNTQQYVTGQRLSAAQNDASARMNREQYLAESRQNLAKDTANMDLSREQYLSEGRRNALQNETSMNLDRENTVRQQRQALNDALASYGLNNAKYMSDSDINRITSILSAYQSNAANKASTEMSAAQLTGAFSDKTPTAAMASATDQKLASAAQQMIQSGITPTDAQLNAIGWGRDQYNAYKAALDAAAKAQSGNGGGGNGGGGGGGNSLYRQIQTLIKGGVKQGIINDYLLQHTASQSYSAADVKKATDLYNTLNSNNYHGKADYDAP